MSTVTELAKAEAERAESEPDEETEPLEEPEPETEPEPDAEPDQSAPEPLTPEQVEKRYKAAGKVAERYAASLAKALGPELMAQMVPSPLDALPGFVQVDFNGQPDPEVKAQTLAFLQFEPPPDYQQNQAMQTCRRCHGYGDLLTGSKRKGNELTQCPDCGGLGYTDPQGMRVGAAPLQLAPAVPQAPATPNGSPETHGMEDPEVTRLRSLGYTVLEPIHVGP
jgi:hypothetical protein